MMKEEEIRTLAEDYIDSCTKKAGFVILAESLKGDFIDIFVAGFMKCLEINKANEWHYVKDGDLPKDEDWKWCVSYRGYYYVAKYEEMFGCWTNQEYSEVMQPYAWKEISLPEQEG